MANRRVNSDTERWTHVHCRTLPPYNVVLVDDDHHSYHYVINMLRTLFGYSEPKAYKMTEEVDKTGRVILLTKTLEHAELKRDQIHAFGLDRRLAFSMTAMCALVEPDHR